MKKILIGSEEICGLIAQFSSYYKTKGYNVVSIATKNNFFNHQYDIDPEDFLTGWKKHSQKSEFFKSVVSLLFSISPARVRHALLWRLKLNFLQEFDLYINIWKCFIDEEMAFNAAKKAGVKWMTICMGDDFRNRWAFQRNFNVSDDLLPGVNKDQDHLLSRIKRIRLHEKNAAVIFSGPDQSSLSLRPYFHAHVPTDLSETTFSIPENKILKIVHCPSDSNAKGTRVIEAVVQELMAEGYEIEFLSLRNIPHQKLMDILSEADILVDELVFHGPGYLSIEAMASGCAVVTKYFEDSPESFRPPVVSATEKNLKDKLKELLNNRPKIKLLAEEGRKYVEKNNSLDVIADYYLNCLLERTDFDYYPDYFRNEFDPETFGLSLEVINQTTDQVRNERWYAKFITPGERKGLRF